MPDWTADLSPFITAIMGFAAAYVPVLWQGRRERETRQHEREVAARERREEFELSHLVEVHALLRQQQDALFGLSSALSEWRRSFLETDGTGDEPQFDPEPRERLVAASAAVSAQIGFILSDQVREEIEDAHHAAQLTEQALMAMENPEFDALDDIFHSAFAVLTARVREIYVGR